MVMRLIPEPNAMRTIPEPNAMRTIPEPHEVRNMPAVGTVPSERTSSSFFPMSACFLYSDKPTDDSKAGQNVSQNKKYLFAHVF